jgi:hypothetical protein
MRCLGCFAVVVVVVVACGKPRPPGGGAPGGGAAEPSSSYVGAYCGQANFAGCAGSMADCEARMAANDEGWEDYCEEEEGCDPNAPPIPCAYHAVVYCKENGSCYPTMAECSHFSDSCYAY